MTILTTRRDLAVLAKTYHGRAWPKTYANLTQAQNAARAMGEGWSVYGRYPYTVARPAAELLPACAPANEVTP